VERPQTTRVAIAVVRTVIEPRVQPVIRILEVSDLFRDERVLGVTTSADEAADIVLDWLRAVVPSKVDPDV
jgi:hypothetical protein